jgi:hypothetical protein
MTTDVTRNSMLSVTLSFIKYTIASVIRGMDECLLSPLPGPTSTEAEFMNVQFRSGFLGIILKVLRLEVSVYNVYITIRFQSHFSGGGGGGRE